MNRFCVKKIFSSVLKVTIGIILGIIICGGIYVYKINNQIYGIYVCDELKNLCLAETLPKEFVFVDSITGLVTVNSEKKVKEKQYPVALRISQKEIVGKKHELEQVKLLENQRRFILDQWLYFPVLTENDGKQKSVKIYSEKKFPQGVSAIPYDECCAGDENYSAVATSYVECEITLPLKEELVAILDEWLNQVFKEVTIKKNCQNDKTVFIAAVGDIMAGRGVDWQLLAKDGEKKVFTDTLPILQKSDFLIGNLEGAITGKGSKAIKTYTFRFTKKILPVLKKAGFDYLMLTNNHTFDYGMVGFLDTLAALKEYNIPTSGVGLNLSEAQKFYHTTIKNVPISVISCGAYPKEKSGFDGKKDAAATVSRAGILWQSKEIYDLVRAEKEKGYFVIVNVHGGQEYTFKPSTEQRKFYETLCDYGADVIFGSHPHVLQPIEWYGNSLIVYSLGNFVFPGMEEMPGGTDSLIVRLGIYKNKILYKEEYPVKLDGIKVHLK